ncbi:dihydrolipoyl dehydrogenase family protein [Megalodesulfovibrio paquesii]
MRSFDLLIIGGGPAGHVAARDAATRGLSVALAEQHLLGGTCLNVGCIPTKVLLGATAAAAELKSQQKRRLCKGEIEFDLKALMKRKDQLVAGSRAAVEKELTGLGVTLLKGPARFVHATQAAVRTSEGDVEVIFRQAIVATGTRPAGFPGLEADGNRVLDSDALLSITNIPKSIIVLGGGAIGLELGEWLSRLGTAVTIVEAADRLAPLEDPEISAQLKTALGREGWSIHLGKKAITLQTVGETARCELEDGTVLEAELALMALGRRPNTGELDLQNAGIDTDQRGFINIDEMLRASETVFAVGDVNGRALWAHAAMHQARHAVRNIMDEVETPYPFPSMPGCIYGTHEVMRVGKTLQELENEPEVSESRAMLAANPLAQAHGASAGIIKCFWAGGHLAGVTAMGWNVSHLVTLAQTLVNQGMTQDKLQDLVFAHPTLDEALEAALTAPRTTLFRPGGMSA